MSSNADIGVSMGCKAIFSSLTVLYGPSADGTGPTTKGIEIAGVEKVAVAARQARMVIRKKDIVMV